MYCSQKNYSTQKNRLKPNVIRGKKASNAVKDLCVAGEHVNHWVNLQVARNGAGALKYTYMGPGPCSFKFFYPYVLNFLCAILCNPKRKSFRRLRWEKKAQYCCVGGFD